MGNVDMIKLAQDAIVQFIFCCSYANYKFNGRFNCVIQAVTQIQEQLYPLSLKL